MMMTNAWPRNFDNELDHQSTIVFGVPIRDVITRAGLQNRETVAQLMNCAVSALSMVVNHVPVGPRNLPIDILRE